MTSRPKTVAEWRAELDAAKVVAMNKFERDWGTRDVQTVVSALRGTISQSNSPGHWAGLALAKVRAGTE